MAENLILSRESSESEIKRYFNAVLKLSQSDNEFPINLDEVWPLVYIRRDVAVKELKNNFIESIDYQPLHQKVEQNSLQNGSGGHNKVIYHLTLSCMEFFIARKVRPVFEVYRQVFHKTVKSVEIPNFNNPSESARAWADLYDKNQMLQLEVHSNQKLIEQMSAKIAGDRPKVTFADCFLHQQGDRSIEDLANILTQSGLYSKGSNKLKEWMRKNGWLIKRGPRKNKPTQKSMSKKYMRLVSERYNVDKVFVTANGQKFFITEFRRIRSNRESYKIEW